MKKNLKNIFKPFFSVFVALAASASLWAGTPLANLNFEITSATTAVPSGYTYSATNTPNIKTQNNIKCIIVSDGGGSTAPTFSGDNEPSGGKRWMAFSPDVNCSAKIYVMSNKKEFYIQSAAGKFASYTNTANAVEEFNVSGFEANKWYALCGANSQVYITKIEFTATSGGGGGGGQTTTYTITYNNNGHGTAPSQVTGATALPATLPIMTENGWTFDGWYTDAALTTPATAGATISANTTLYAKWTQNQQQGGGGQQGGGSSTDCGELIKVVLSGSNGSTQTVTGTVGGTAGVKNMGSSSPYKLNSDGAYVYIKLTDGHYFQAGDVLTIDGNKAMEVHTGDVANGNSTMLDHTAGPSNGIITYTLPANLPASTNTLSVYRSSSTYNGTLTYMAVNRTCTGPAPLSTDATLSDLKVDGVIVAGFAAATTTYNVTIPATQTTDPVVSATKNDSKAGDPVISQAALPTPGQTTTATVVVTAEDGTTTNTYTINFTRAELSHDADLKDIQVNGQSISGFTAATLTYNVTVPFSATTNTVVTANTNNTAAQAVVTGPNAVIGTATITVTAEDGTTTKTYTVNITKAAASSDATLSALQYNGTSVPNFSANTLTYSVELPYGTTAAALVTATANYSAANVQITQPTAAAGSATIVVTAEDGTTTKTYTITFTVADEPADPIIPTTPGVHSPGVYIWDKEDGGYGQQFVTYNNEQYEVFYINRDGTNSKLGISTSNADKGGFFPATGTDDKKFAASDNWIVANTNGRGGDTGFGAQAEFGQSVHCAKFQANYSLEMKVRGYSEFAMVAKDNNADASKGRYFVVTIDGVNQTHTLNSDSYSIRRYALTAEEQHTIKITAVGSSDGKMVAFSLKVGTTPDMPAPVLEKFSGKDSGQVVYQSQQIIPISYRVKYNRKTELEWIGNAATGIDITTHKGPKYDTIRVEGAAQCPIGNYHYRIVTKVNNQPVMSKDGYFEVKSKIWATTDTVVNGWTGQAIRRIQFRYYALSDANVHIQWTGAAPAGITASGQDGVYTISGQTATAGTYFFTISVDGGNSVQGKIIIKNFNPGANPILYLYKGEYEDGIYKYLKSAGKNPIEMEQNGELRADYSIYTMIIISESCDANDGEVLAVARGEANKPVLNMKSFTYAPGRLDWGEPDNGSLVNRSVIVRQPAHPIFTKLGKKRGDAIVVLDSIAGTGLMPIAAQMNGTLCLATAMTRGRDYTENGKDETFLHEIPASMRGGKKYLTFPVSTRSSELLSRDGKSLLLGCIDYLLSNEPTIQLPELEITEIRVKLDSTYYYGEIDNEKNEIIITVPADMDLTQLVPEVTIKDAINSHVDPAPGTVVDMSDSFFGVDFTVSDFVNQRVYNVRLIVETGLEEILEDEGWVNIYDIRGQKVTTTNDVRGLSLPSGIYIVVGQKGSHKISVL